MVEASASAHTAGPALFSFCVLGPAASQEIQSMRREYPEAPIAAVGVVVTDGERVLLIRRGKEPNRGRWSLPGGAVELGETVRAAAAREIAEECGVEAVAGDVIEVLDAITPGENGRPRFHYVLVELLADYVSGTPHADTDALETQWFTLDELPGLNLPPITERIVRLGAALHRRNADSGNDSPGSDSGAGGADEAGGKAWQNVSWS
jgi:8-oxo-dGTP diphosphatase